MSLDESSPPERPSVSLIEKARLVHIQLAHPGFRALTDLEVVERMLLFASGATDAEFLDAANAVGQGFLAGSSAPPEFEADLRRVRASSSELVGRLRLWWRNLAPDRARWCTALDTIIKGSKAERDRLAAEAQDLRELQLVVIPRLRWTGSESILESLYFCSTFDAACAHVTLLLLDRKRSQKLGGSLRKCKLQSCGKYFISRAPDGGGPRPLYCQAEHRKIAAKLSGPERTERWRKKQLTLHK